MRLIRLLKHDLARETREWVEQEFITPAQAEAICRSYGIDYRHTAQRAGGYWVLVLLGYLFLGLAAITLISANWDQIPRGLRMGGLILVTMATHGVGFYKLRQGEETAAAGFFFLGSLFYGASIMLIAQIYHIGEHFPDGTLVWALGVLPLALILRSRALMLLAASLGAIWFMLEAHLGVFPWRYPLFLCAMAWHLLRTGPCRVLFVMLVLLTGLFCELSISWAINGWDHLEFTLENFFFAAGYGILCWGLGLFLDTRDRPDFRDYASLITLWALRGVILLLFILSFEDAWRELIVQPWQTPAAALGTATLMGLAAVILAGTGRSGSDRVRAVAAPGLCALLYLGTMAALIMCSDRDFAIWFTVADNLLLILSGVWLIISGIREAVSHYFFLGVVVILLTGLVRYMDLVGDYIGAAALFTLFAVILLVSARFWKSRFSPHDTGKGAS